MLGAFKATKTAYGGLVWKLSYKLNGTRKTNVRERMKCVEKVENTLKSVGDIKAFHKEDPLLPLCQLQEGGSKYWIETLRGRKGIHKIPHFTKNWKSKHGFYERPAQK